MIRYLAAIALGVILGTIYTAARFYEERARELVDVAGGLELSFRRSLEAEPEPFDRPGGRPLVSCSECGGWHPAGGPASCGTVTA